MIHLSIPKSWKQSRLEDASEQIDYGYTASATQAPVGPKFLRITDIYHDLIDWETVPFCNAKETEVTKYRLKPGDIVIARTGSAGNSRLIVNCPEKTIFASYLIRVRPSSVIDPRFLAYFFQTTGYWSQVRSQVAGAVQSGINATKLKSLVIPFPPMSEQKRIAAILDQSDTIRRKRRETIQATAKLPAAIFFDMFGDPATNTRGWPTAQFGSLLPYGLRNGESPATNGDIRGKVLTLNAITGPVFDPTAWKEAEFAHFHENSRVSTNDFLICRGNGNRELVGVAKRPTINMRDTVFPDTMIAAQVDATQLDLPFLESQWETQHVCRQILQGARTTNGTYKINQQVISGIHLIVPPVTIQNKFGDQMKAIQDILVKEEQAVYDAGLVFDSLIYRAFRGLL